MESFLIHGRNIMADIVYKPIRHCYIRVKAPGYLYITCNRKFHKSDILALIESHYQRLFAQLDAVAMPANVVGQTLFGNPLASMSETAYANLLKRETIAKCETLYQEWLPRIAPLLKAGKPLFKAQAMTSRFGSCHVTNNTIKLNSWLAMLDPRYMENVFLHEIVHLKAPDHGATFYRHLLELSPQYRSIHRELKRIFSARKE